MKVRFMKSASTTYGRGSPRSAVEEIVSVMPWHQREFDTIQEANEYARYFWGNSAFCVEIPEKSDPKTTHPHNGQCESIKSGGACDCEVKEWYKTKIESEKDMEIGAGTINPKIGLDSARLKESEELLRSHLVTLHDDGDDNSLFVRFGEFMREMERLQENDASWGRVCDAITNSQHTFLNRLLKAVKDERESRELSDDPGGENEDAVWRRNNDQLDAVIKEIEEHQRKQMEMKNGKR